MIGQAKGIKDDLLGECAVKTPSPNDELEARRVRQIARLRIVLELRCFAVLDLLLLYVLSKCKAQVSKFYVLKK
jgi:hypothetical protein